MRRGEFRVLESIWSHLELTRFTRFLGCEITLACTNHDVKGGVQLCVELMLYVVREQCVLSIGENNIHYGHVKFGGSEIQASLVLSCFG